ncbi:hypothetical protein Moror_9708 [Moniliophthora roreri MCA 2997]|uniref:Uncharacterized protein n=1 Tax=Moniliophthora roreri (strain MCA 2997) TaxID=1381753 RepID=V2WYL0_MONRO|nr:hypothetical protein Moror_9708 [Moniliophthora roreri MCA 2997]
MALNYVQPELQLPEDDSWDGIDSSDLLDETKSELSESQLRELYDNEEIERFLALFAANVTEVQIPKSPPVGHFRTEHIRSETDEKHHSASESPSLSEDIALKYLLPILPPPPPSYPFTLGRLRLTTQRLYLSIVPAYWSFLQRLVKLAIWEDKAKSTTYCCIYWFLWYHNLLLPSLVLRTLYCLVRRRIFPYPTIAELRERRAEIDRAEELGDEVSARLVSSSGFGVREMWRIFRVFTKSEKPKESMNKETAKGKGKDKKGKGIGKEKMHFDDQAPHSEQVEAESEYQQPEDHEVDVNVQDDAIVLDNPSDTLKERDLKRSALHFATEIADLHERIHNLFIWRRPKSSWNYGMLIFLCFLITLIVPAQYIAKLFYFIVGVLFWHVAPVIAALPREDRARLPPILADVPTDSDFAMELISQRIAAGLDVRPPRHRKRQKKKVSTPQGSPAGPSPAMKGWSDVDKRIDWKKWGDRAAVGKAWAVDKKLIGNKEESNLPRSPLVPPPATAMGRSSSPVETHTFPCHHSTAPGLITLSPMMFYFTPMMSPNPKVSFPMSYLVSVKKAGLLKGLTIKWCDPRDGQEHEEVFKWVGGRDELFARLIGTDARKWMTT